MAHVAATFPVSHVVLAVGAAPSPAALLGDREGCYLTRFNTVSAVPPIVGEGL